MSDRIAFLPAPGDCYVLLHAISYFNKFWSDEIDRLYVHINSPIDRNVVYATIEELKKYPKISVMYSDSTINHGLALEALFAASQEKYIMLIEDDCFVFKKGVIDHYFKLLENNTFDFIGTPRGSCSQNWANISKEKFNLDYSGMKDIGVNFWPNMAFFKRELILKTDRYFGAKTFNKGEVFLGQTLSDLACADTMGHLSVQIRELGARILEIPSFHSNPQDLEFYKPRRLGLFSGKASYLHTGSLSSGLNGYLVDENDIPLGKRHDPNAIPEVRNARADVHIGEIENRICWWKESYETVSATGFYIKGFSEAYKYAINKLMERTQVSDQDINKWLKLYKGDVMGLM